MFSIGQSVSVTVPNDIAFQPYNPDDGHPPAWRRLIMPGVLTNADVQAICEVVACADHDTDNPGLVVAVPLPDGHEVCVCVPAGECCAVVTTLLDPVKPPKLGWHDMGGGFYSSGPFDPAFDNIRGHKHRIDPYPTNPDIYVGPADIDDFLHDYDDTEVEAMQNDWGYEDEYDDEPSCGDDDEDERPY